MTASNVFLFGAAAPGSAEGRVRGIAAQQVPKVREAALALREQVVSWDFAGLESVLLSHLNGLAGLRFDLLVSPGLRAGPLERDQAAFRGQVAAVSDCTEATWRALRRTLELGKGARGEAEALAAEFAMESRSLLRRVAEESRTAGALQATLQARAHQAATEAARKALHDMAARNGGVFGLLDRLQRLCDAARPLQASAYELAEAHTELLGTMRKLAARLKGGLLERLRALVTGEMGSPADELRQAQQARSELQSGLSEAISEVQRVQSCSQDLLVWLKAVEHEAQSVIPAEAGIRGFHEPGRHGFPPSRE
ncbi:hypothetical protein [Ramlibacter humi]|uniref:Uncharacterized protein n=1 Tax=Ramlibacter humi TaxID=2530451 RepID=A0A4Z0CAM2_9BURK|nr:hypothetical protein [Ramlibacter humi]TFZ08391.1 hypothetical protein EZ216_04340 [Ramlibacter humi]